MMLSGEALDDLLSLPGGGTAIEVARVTADSVEIVRSGGPGCLTTEPGRYFDLASITKLYTATRVLQEVTSGSMSLNAQADSYLTGELSKVGDVAILDLIGYAGGFPPHIPLSDLEPFRSDPLAYLRFGRDSVLEKLVESAQAERLDNRRARLYNNLSYVLLGDALAELCSWGDVNRQLSSQGLPQTMYNPLSAGVPLNDVVPTESDGWRIGRCRGVVHDETAFLLGGYAGHAGLFATIEDVAEMTRRWMMLDDQLGVAEDLWAPQVLATQSAGVFRNTAEYSGREVRNVPSGSIGLSGFTGTSLWIDLQQHVAVVILTNRVFAGRDPTWIMDVRERVHGIAFRPS